MSNYINEKLKILRDLKIKLTDEQKEHMKLLHTEIAIDNYVKPLIMNSYEKYGY